MCLFFLSTIALTTLIGILLARHALAQRADSMFCLWLLLLLLLMLLLLLVLLLLTRGIGNQIPCFDMGMLEGCGNIQTVARPVCRKAWSHTTRTRTCNSSARAYASRASLKHLS